MKNVIRILVFLMSISFCLSVVAGPTNAQQRGSSGQPVAEGCQTDDDKRPHDRLALEGVKVGRIFWDITIADPVVLVGRLKVIEETYRDMVRQGVTPNMILAFRGGSVRLLSADLTKLSKELQTGAIEVQQHLSKMMELPNVRIESCYIAMRRVPLEAENMIKGIHTVNNTFLSAMGYGQKGYIALPIH